MMYRRDAALAAGGYDPGFAPVWFDDLDLTMALRRDGLKVFFLPGRPGGASRRRPPSGQPDPARRASGVPKALARRLLPRGARVRAMRALGLDRAPREHRERLEHHYAYWREKWGFDILNPDMEAVRARWGERRSAGGARPSAGGRRARSRRPTRRRALAVSVDARPLDIENLRAQGIGRYAHGLLGPLVELAAERGADLTLIRQAQPDAEAPSARCGKSRVVRRPPLPARAVELVEQALLPLDLARVGADVHHSLSLYRAPWCRRAAPVVTMHDVAPLQWPERYLRTGVAHRTLYRAVRRAAAVICPSSAAARDVAHHLELEPGRVTLIPEAADSSLSAPSMRRRSAGGSVSRGLICSTGRS